MLTVAELRGQREARAAVNHETYKQLFEQVQQRIRARAANDLSELLWQVPPLVPGRPVYAPLHAARYVTDKLRRGGFEVRRASPASDVHVLYVTWRTRGGADAADRRHRRPAASRGASHPSPGGSAARQTPISVAEASQRLERLKAHLRL